MKTRTYLVILPAVVIAIMVTVMVLGTPMSETVSEPVADPTPVPHFSMETVPVQITEDAVESTHQDPVYVQLENGVIPDDVTHLTVLTDEDCIPDDQGVSHCLNRVEFQTGDGMQQAALRHHHNMAIAPCLTPGQVLELVR